MTPELERDLMAALERPHRLGTIGGDLEEQLAHCASFSSVLDDVWPTMSDVARCVDLGTGGGLPGVALAAARPTSRWTLVDMRTARATEVERTVLHLGLADRVEVRGIEAQRLAHDVAYRESFDVAVARAFGPPSITAECAAGLLRVGGVFVVSEPPASSDGDDRWPLAGLHALGFATPTMITQPAGSFAVLVKKSPTVDRIPRLPARSNRGWFNPS